MNAKDFDSGADGHLAALDGGDQLGRAVVEHFAGALDAAFTDVEKFCRLPLRHFANWRKVSARALWQRRDLPRDQSPLALVEVPPVQVQRRSPPTRYQGQGVGAIAAAVRVATRYAQ